MKKVTIMMTIAMSLFVVNTPVMAKEHNHSESRKQELRHKHDAKSAKIDQRLDMKIEKAKHQNKDQKVAKLQERKKDKHNQLDQRFKDKAKKHQLKSSQHHKNKHNTK